MLRFLGKTCVVGEMAAFFFFSALYFVLHGLQTAGYYKLDQKVDVVIKVGKNIDK